MPGHRRQKSSAGYQRLWNLLPWRGSKGESTQTVELPPKPPIEEPEATPTHHPAVCAFLAGERRGSLGGQHGHLQSPDSETPSAGITRSQTCPNLIALRTSGPLLSSPSPALRPAISTPDRASARPRRMSCCEQGQQPLHGILRTPSLGGADRARSITRPSTSTVRPASFRESITPAQSPWGFFRNSWFPVSRAESPVRRPESLADGGATTDAADTVTLNGSGDDKSIIPMCESPVSLSPPTSTSTFFSVPRSRNHSRAPSDGLRLKTADSGHSRRHASSSSCSTAASSVCGREVRFVNDINLNRRHNNLPSSMVPFWYIRNPQEDRHDGPRSGVRTLCKNCRHIDMPALFAQKDETDRLPSLRDHIALGSLLDLMTRTDCGLCQLVARVIVHDARLSLGSDLGEDERTAAHKVMLCGILEQTYYLCPVRLRIASATDNSNCAELYIFSAKDIKDPSLLPRRSMAIRPIDAAGDQPEPGSGRLMRSASEIDCDWVRDRIRLCDECDQWDENDSVAPSAAPADPAMQQMIRAVDVKQMCVVELLPDERYVALSYTWGDASQLLLQTWNSSELQYPKGLLNFWDSIPRTTQDAIRMTREIGERYLWVDALCVVHDDPEDFDAQLAAMGQIYASSVLTICACCGEDADYGLPGAEPGTRSTRQVVEMVGSLVVGSVLPRLDPENVVGGKWASRAWTLQEHLLSRRKLLITEDCATWWCRHGMTAEDEHCAHVGHNKSGGEEGSNSSKSSRSHRSGKSSLASKDQPRCAANLNRQHGIVNCGSNMDIYASIVTEYTRRNLTNTYDVERAVTGLLQDLRPLFRGDFMFGLPDTELSAALMWCPLGPSSRRIYTETGQPLFPSWSWLGWTGKAAYPWLVERSMPMSEEAGSPLLWRNMAEHMVNPRRDGWFTGYEYRLNGLSHPNDARRGPDEGGEWREDDDDVWTHVEEFDDEVMDVGVKAKEDDDDAGAACRWLNPVLPEPVQGGRLYRYMAPGSGRLHFRSITAKFSLEPKVRVRREQYGEGRMAADVNIVRVLDSRGFAAGYIYFADDAATSSLTTPDAKGATSNLSSRKHEFVALSRASTRRDPRVGQELLHATPLAELGHVYSLASFIGGGDKLRPMTGDFLDDEDVGRRQQQHSGGRTRRSRESRERTRQQRRRLHQSGDELGIDEVAHFDTRLYDASTPWGLFNVMLVEWRESEEADENGRREPIAERVAVGRIHVAAFMDAAPVEKDVMLE